MNFDRANGHPQFLSAISLLECPRKTKFATWRRRLVNLANSSLVFMDELRVANAIRRPRRKFRKKPV
jgi:hypothetical protein